jgi:hypothetical protein
VGTDRGGVSLEAIISIAVMLFTSLWVLAYAWSWSRQRAVVRRFNQRVCPACQQGRLVIEMREDRIVGVPRYRHTIRCDTCRSVLRETSSGWRYAVDRLANEALFTRFNSRLLSTPALLRLLDEPKNHGKDE